MYIHTNSQIKLKDLLKKIRFYNFSQRTGYSSMVYPYLVGGSLLRAGCTVVSQNHVNEGFLFFVLFQINC